jgi:hypothetical protein
MDQSARTSLKGNAKMFNATDHTSGEAVQNTLEVVTPEFYSEQVFQGPLQIRVHDQPDVCSDETMDNVAALMNELADTCERTLQALRDIRHMLPPEGVAIVDAALNCAT